MLYMFVFVFCIVHFVDGFEICACVKAFLYIQIYNLNLLYVLTENDHVTGSKRRLSEFMLY